MVEFWDAVTNILIVAIPTLIGAFGSRYIVNSWQTKKEEFRLKKEQWELRKQILAVFHSSFVEEFLCISQFRNEMKDMFVTDWSFKKGEKDDEKLKSFMYSLVFPEKIEEFKSKVKPEFEKFLEEYKKFRSGTWNFYHTVRIYYNVKELDELISNASVARRQAFASVNLFMYSKNTEECDKNYLELRDQLNIFWGSIHKLAGKLANAQLRVPY